MTASPAKIPVVGETPARPDFEAAQQAVAEDKSLQFEMSTFEAPRPPNLSWLEGIGDFFAALGPLFQVIFWLGIAVVVGSLLWFIGRELIRVRLPQKKDKAAPEQTWRPAPEAAVALLSDADALAGQGRFAEAVHLLLLRSIDDIDGRLPNTVRPALTSRDIARIRRLPEAARPAFGRIAAVVESSLFGGQSVDRQTFIDCRQAYEAFALPKAWTA